MNFLFHMFLSGDDQELLTGNFMGDFVKGALHNRYPATIERGLLLHRKIDSFAQTNRFFQASRQRLAPHYGHYRGIMVDIFYDHFLSQSWDCWHNMPLPRYLLWARGVIDHHRDVMPVGLQGLLPTIFDELLPSYGTLDGIASALQRMSRRVHRSNPLADGAEELAQHYEALQDDFALFMRDIVPFVATFTAANCRQTEEPETGGWQLWRQDEHGNRFLVGDFRMREPAQQRMAELTRKPHKQTYWIAYGGPAY